MLVAFVIIALYVAGFATNLRQVAPGLIINDLTAMIAGGIFALGFFSYLWAPKRYFGVFSAIAYIALTGLVCLIIYSTGGFGSPFASLWMLLAIFAGIFGWWGIIGLFLLLNGYLGWLIYQGNSVVTILGPILLIGELPLLISSAIWYHHGSTIGETSENRSYNELASQLSQVAGKSEVVINAISDGVIAIGIGGVIELINPAAQSIIGWDKHDALGLSYKSVLKLVDDKDQEVSANNPVEQVLATNQELKTDKLSLVTQSEKKLIVALTVSPVGQPGSGVIITFRDITKEKAEEHQQAEFISTASHEMRTPVASIEGYLGLALNPATATIDEKARDFITKAHESAQHLGHLFQDLLDVSKSEDGRLASNPKVIDLVPFVARRVEGLQAKATEKGLVMVFKPVQDASTADHGRLGNGRQINPVYFVDVDSDHLDEVISNLLENAIKYTPRGDIVVDVQGDNDHTRISVQDSGIGIPAEDQAHLFQKFYRVDNSDTREIGGTGLGLYLCRRLVDVMGGRIWVESEYKKGSIFYVELPRMDHTTAMQRIEQQVDTAPDTTAVAPPAVIEIPIAPVTVETAPVTPPLAAPAPATPPLQPVSAPLRRNIPISTIEQDPSQYISQPGQLVIPPRN